MKDPLDNFFGVDESITDDVNKGTSLEEMQNNIEDNNHQNPEEEEYISIDIPDAEEANLNDIIRLAFDSYKLQMESMYMIEPKWRSKYIELANDSLKLAKDTIKQKEELQQKREKLELEKEKAGKAKSKKGTDEKTAGLDAGSNVVPIDDLYSIAKAKANEAK